MTQGNTTALADELDALAAYLEQLWSAQKVCQSVASHRATPPKQAAEAWLLGRWIGEPDLEVAS
jgi:hypothetical protein